MGARAHHRARPTTASASRPNAREILPAFIRYDCLRDAVIEIAPRERPAVTLPPAQFGDDWSETLERDEAEAVARVLPVDRASPDASSTSSPCASAAEEHVVVPRRGAPSSGASRSRRRATRWCTAVAAGEIFDDLLIGNFMRTTLHGRVAGAGLYPDFTPYVAKYADNADARTPP